jgi:hypothetical protein
MLAYRGRSEENSVNLNRAFQSSALCFYNWARLCDETNRVLDM